MIVAVRSESGHAELFLSMYYCDSLAVGPGAAAAASPGCGESGGRKFRYSRAFSFCWVFKPHCLGVGKRGGQCVWGGPAERDVVGAAGSLMAGAAPWGAGLSFASRDVRAEREGTDVAERGCAASGGQ